MLKVNNIGVGVLLVNVFVLDVVVRLFCVRGNMALSMDVPIILNAGSLSIHKGSEVSWCRDRSWLFTPVCSDI